jgi:hypothetical protein
MLWANLSFFIKAQEKRNLWICFSKYKHCSWIEVKAYENAIKTFVMWVPAKNQPADTFSYLQMWEHMIRKPPLQGLCYHLGAEMEGFADLHPNSQDRWPFIRSCQIPTYLILRTMASSNNYHFAPLRTKAPGICPASCPAGPSFVASPLDSFYPRGDKERRLAVTWKAFYFLSLCYPT